jgi:hypothetical protein
VGKQLTLNIKMAIYSDVVVERFPQRSTSVPLPAFSTQRSVYFGTQRKEDSASESFTAQSCVDTVWVGMQTFQIILVK